MIQLTQYAEQPDTSINQPLPSAQEMIERYMTNIKKCAKTICAKLPFCWGIEPDDLISAGAMNILTYGKCYDPTKGTTLKTYVISCAKHGMLEELRRCDYVNRGVRRTVKTYTLKYQRLMARSKYMPTIVDFAEAYDIAEEQVHNDAVLTNATEREARNIQNQLQQYGADLKAMRNRNNVENIEAPFEVYIHKLPEMQQAVLRMRYKEDRDWTEIAETLQIPENSAYYHQRKAFAVLKPRMKNDIYTN